MASDGANEEPYASEYAEKGSPNDSDNDEGTNVEHNASVTKLLTTQGIRGSPCWGGESRARSHFLLVSLSSSQSVFSLVRAFTIRVLFLRHGRKIDSPCEEKQSPPPLKKFRRHNPKSERADSHHNLMRG